MLNKWKPAESEFVFSLCRRTLTHRSTRVWASKTLCGRARSWHPVSGAQLFFTVDVMLLCSCCVAVVLLWALAQVKSSLSHFKPTIPHRNRPVSWERLWRSHHWSAVLLWPWPEEHTRTHTHKAWLSPLTSSLPLFTHTHTLWALDPPPGRPALFSLLRAAVQLWWEN